MTYHVIVSQEALRDIREAVFYKEGLGAYKENIDKFVKELRSLIYERLSTSPMIGANVSARVVKKTNLKYFVIDDYVLIYEVIKNKVRVIRLFPAKSDWLSYIFDR